MIQTMRCWTWNRKQMSLDNTLVSANYQLHQDRLLNDSNRPGRKRHETVRYKGIQTADSEESVTFTRRRVTRSQQLKKAREDGEVGQGKVGEGKGKGQELPEPPKHRRGQEKNVLRLNTLFLFLSSLLLIVVAAGF